MDFGDHGHDNLDQMNVVLTFATSLFSIGLVFGSTSLSLFIIMSLRSLFATILNVLSVAFEVIIATTAALLSGGTVTLALIMAAVSAAFSVPPSCIKCRMCIAASVGAGAIAVASLFIFSASSMTVSGDLLMAVICASSVSVACASSWAVGVMSLIERETRNSGLKMLNIQNLIRTNHHTVLRLVLKFHNSVLPRDLNFGLISAVRLGHTECVIILLNAGANPDSSDPYDNTPLSVACETGSDSLVRLLIRAGASITMRCSNRGTPLHHAAKWGNSECVRLLLLENANPNVYDALWRTPLMLAIRHAQEPDTIVRMLIDAQTDVNKTGSEQRTALHFAAARGIPSNDLYVAGADVNIQDSEGNIPLHIAALEGHSVSIKELLSNGSNPNALNYQKRSCLHFAAMRGNLDCLNELILAKSDPFHADSANHLPIWYTAIGGHLKCVRYFVSLNCLEIGTTQSINKFTNPLEAALSRNYLSVAKVLLLGGCNPKPLQKWLENTNPDFIAEDKFEDYYWLKSFGSKPRDLMHTCRIVIRQMLGYPVSVEVLPLPRQIKDYIAMSDLVD